MAEGQDISVIDAPGAFLTFDMDEKVIVILENEMINAMLDMDKDVNRKYIIHGKKGKKQCTPASARRCTEHSRQH